MSPQEKKPQINMVQPGYTPSFAWVSKKSHAADTENAHNTIQYNTKKKKNNTRRSKIL